MMRADVRGRCASAPLQTRALAVGYGRRPPRPVLRDVTVTVRAGELVCLLGANGTGKSTLLRTMARLQPALAGTVVLGGTDARALTPGALARRVGVVSTERLDVQALSARSVIELGRYPYAGWLGRLTARDRAAVDQAADAVHAAHLLDRDLSRLSDGERQRVMIARALAQEPVLLVLDEPTAYLDAPSRVELIDLLRHLTRKNGLGVVVSTHDVDLALQAADTAWLALPGGTLHAGAPDEIMRDGTLDRAFDDRPMRLTIRDSRGRGGGVRQQKGGMS